MTRSLTELISRNQKRMRDRAKKKSKNWRRLWESREKKKKIGKDVGDDCYTLLYLHFFWTVPILNVRMRRGLKYFFSCAELEISSGGGGTVMVRIKTFHKYKHVEFNTIEQHKLGLSQTLSAALSIRDLLIAMALIWKKKITAWPTLPIAKTWQCTAYTRWGRWFSIIFFFHFNNFNGKIVFLHICHYSRCNGSISVTEQVQQYLRCQVQS